MIMMLQEKIQAAKAGDVNAMLALGDYYSNNEKEKDLDEAAVWYEKAAELGHLVGMFNAAALAANAAMVNEMINCFTEAYGSWVKAAHWARKEKELLSSEQAQAALGSQTCASLYQNADVYYQEAVYGAASVTYAIQKDYEKAYGFLNAGDVSPSTRNHLLKGCCLYGMFRMAAQKDARTCDFKILGNAYQELANMITDMDYFESKERPTLEEAVFVEAALRLAVIFKSGIPGMQKAEPQKARDLIKMCIDNAANPKSKNALLKAYSDF